MQIKQIRIKNFRSIKQLDLDLSQTSVFIGPNNSGKTAILDALRIALTRRWGQRGSGFTEYDIHLASETDDPKASTGVEIEIRLEELHKDEWSASLQQDLDQILQLDPVTGLNSITLRAKCAWDPAEGAFLPSWAFLNAARVPLVGASARSLNLERFWRYLPVFYLDALRDADDEFSSRSQFWGRLLKAMEIPEPLEKRTQRVLDVLNRKLLQADPRLADIAETLSGVTRIAASDTQGGVDLRLVPLKPWEILSKAQIILRNQADRPWLPLHNHGQGVQSLSVIFLFQAFVDHLLAEIYEVDSTPVLALEEPETHLHPQAARTLWRHIRTLSGQKFITTHSPFFLQHVPFRDIRLVRLTEQGTQVYSLPSTFSARIPDISALQTLISNNSATLSYHAASQTLTVRGKLEQRLYRALLACFESATERASTHAALRKLYEDTLLHISDAELVSLQTFAMRIRGEIFFARKWLLIEGQAEYLVVHALGRAMNYDLDEHGIAVIDAANNGNPVTFVALARALKIPWKALFDGDSAGLGYTKSIAARDFSPAEVATRCANLPEVDLEAQLLRDGLEDELKSILADLGVPNVSSMNMLRLAEALRGHKTAYAGRLALRLASEPTFAQRLPQQLRFLVESAQSLT